MTIENEEKRSTGYLSSSKEEYFSDADLEPGWYRIISKNGDHMPISTPGVEKCGTKNPIWLNGSLPTGTDDVVTRNTCVQSMNDDCEDSFLVYIKLCQGYFIYYLRNSTKNSSYCFGEGPVLCYDGLQSESGYYPGCATSFPNETVIPEVQSFLKENMTSHSLRTTFKCKFEDVSNGEYVYDVYWYINDNSVTVHHNIPFHSIDTTDLLDSEWADQYNMNMKVKCSIKLRFAGNSIPGPFMTSSVFDAGFFVSKLNQF
ncbi:oncoprotein-induced transcript 3 protein-like [Mytilus galloprovincialis]|uniref:oncoprotein-induced transcript 3 protein-like n=1 Tax=Mytilus galloprovincialis TaxID=29158 RepID=UPI003F7B580B